MMKIKNHHVLIIGVVNSLYGWAMLQKLQVNKFEWIKESSQFNEDFTKNNEESDKGYFLEVDVPNPEKLHELHNDLPFLPERMKIEKVKKLVTNLDDKAKDVIHIRKLKQALNHGLILKKVHTVIKISQKFIHIDMNTKLRQKAKNNFEKYFFKLLNNVVFGKVMELNL